ncbi:hypothetical protein Trco_001855 [Trichoderma cornu-damae]|uniref:Uncharacterized protein n=1 Tax=Trichoderma cornu-damae TaxID=654480 RepID=A0A9P8TXA3_9HYPO|nr:hypothetical protein Trco_001855 [Trichoderma cornu-damae]
MQTKGIEPLPHRSLFNNENCGGPEDQLVLANREMQARDLNVAMYKAFNDSITMLRGTGHGVETMGYSSLFGDERWKIPPHFPDRDRSADCKEAKGKTVAKKTARSSRFDIEKQRNPSDFSSQSRPCDHNEAKDKADAREFAESSTSGNEQPEGYVALVIAGICAVLILALIGGLTLLWAIKNAFDLDVPSLLGLTMGILFALRLIFAVGRY